MLRGVSYWIPPRRGCGSSGCRGDALTPPALSLKYRSRPPAVWSYSLPDKKGWLVFRIPLQRRERGEGGGERGEKVGREGGGGRSRGRVVSFYNTITKAPIIATW